MKNKFLKLSILVTVAVMFLSACNLANIGGAPISADTLNTMTAGTVSAQLTQISVQTLIAQATQIAMATATPSFTSTPTITATPLITFTPTVTSTSTATATATVTATSTVPPVPCNQASFITDVTIPDGTSLVAGQGFVKTWRVKNNGSCNWTTGYSIYFVNGNALGGPASAAFPATVKPGQSMDISVPMVAPGNTGDFSGNWMLKAPNGSVFGVGAGGGVPLTVKIKVTGVPGPLDKATVYDFVGKYCDAQWRTNAGFIGCPTSGFDFKNGTVSRSYAPVHENGAVDDEGSLITIPSIGGDGFVQGQFPKILLHSGDHFKATVTCTANMPKCSISYEVLYKIVGGSETLTSLGTWEEVYDGGYQWVDIDLSALDGKEVIFYLRVSSKGDSTDDYAQWMAARITHP